MTVAIYPGSFDPITLGHFDIITRASEMFDQVYVVIMKNPKKGYLFSEDERKEMIVEVCSSLSNVVVEIGSGLTADYAKEKNAKVIIRGLRALMDFEYELQIAHINAHLASEIETVFLATKQIYGHISSSIVKDLAAENANLEGLIPDVIAARIKEKYK